MLFSVVIPVYNVETLLDRCISSFVNQKNISQNEYEIVLVDDGSKDSSGRKCDKWGSDYPHLIKVIHKDNEGLLLARRTGLRYASGQYIVNCDSDDYVENNLLYSLKEVIEKDDLDVLFYNLYTETEDEKKVFFSNIFTDDSYCIVDKRDVYINYLTSYQTISMCAKAYKRNIFKNIKDYNEFRHLGFGEDALQSLEIINSAEKFGYINRSLYTYCQGNGMTDKYNADYFDTFMVVFKEIVLQTKDWELDDLEMMLTMKLFSIVARSITQGKEHKFSYIERKNLFEKIMSNEFVIRYKNNYSYISNNIQKNHRIVNGLLLGKHYLLLHLLLCIRR